MKRLVPCLALVFLAAVMMKVFASPEELECLDGGGGGYQPPEPSEDTPFSDLPDSLGPMVETRIVFITADGLDSLEMACADWLAAEVADFFDHSSNGKQKHHVEIIRRLDDSTLAWRAPANDPSQNWGTTHKLLIEDIYDAYQAIDSVSVWRGVERLVAIHYKCLWPPSRCTFGYGRLSNYLASINIVDQLDSEFEFKANGITLTLGSNNFFEVYEDSVPRVLVGVVHELGHTFASALAPWKGAPDLPWPHPPSSGNSIGVDGPGVGVACGETPAAGFVNMGRYSIMTGIQGGDATFPIVSYHPWYLINAGWVECDTISADTMGLRIPDIRDSTEAKVFWVKVPDELQTADLRFNQNFMVAQFGGSGRDQRWGNSGLLIWHFLADSLLLGENNLTAWDLESARGKYDYSGTPEADPVAGLDSLELDWCFEGSAGDFFDGDTFTDFTSLTNPSTNFYDSTYAGPQSVFTGVAFENMTVDGSDMLVDLYLTPKQHVAYPNGSEAILAGDSFTVQWTTRPAASVDSVAILLSDDSGESYAPIASGLSNSGSYSMAGISTTGSDYRVRVVSYNETPVQGTDDSNADFTIWGIDQSTVAHSNVQVLVDSIMVTVTWNTNIATQAGADQVEFYDAQSGGNLITPVWSSYSTSNGGLTHTAVLKITPCVALQYYYYEASTTLSGATATSTRTTSTRFKVSACLEF